MKINSIETALQIFIDSAIIHTDASEEGDYKLCNKHYDRIVFAASYLKENKLLNELYLILENENIGVKLWAATYMLGIDESRAKKVLIEVEKMQIPHLSLDAKTILGEWNSGNLVLQFK